MIISVAASAQQQYPLKKIYETKYWESQNKRFKDTISRYSLTTIDSILSNNDTVFEIKYYEIHLLLHRNSNDRTSYLFII